MNNYPSSPAPLSNKDALTSWPGGNPMLGGRHTATRKSTRTAARKGTRTTARKGMRTAARKGTRTARK